MQYSITIMRFDDDNTQTELSDRYITADQAIEALLFVQSLDPIEEEAEVEEEEEAEPEVDDEPEVKEKPETKPVPPKGKRVTYDKAELEADIRADILTTSELASKYRVGTGTIYQARHVLKHADPVAVADDTPPLTEYAQKQAGRAEVVTADVNIEGEIKLAAIQGFSVSEIAAMYPNVPLARIAELKENTRH